VKRDPDVSAADQRYPVPLSYELSEELCRVCFEPVRLHWRGRACLEARDDRCQRRDERERR
jgi:hypothetical protein